MLGPIEHVNQGKTPRILLPAVCKFNALHSGSEILELQSVIRETLWGMREASIVSEQRNLVAQEADLGDLTDAIVKELGLKRRLSEVGVRRDIFERLAEASLRDPFLETNCVPISRKGEVLERARVVELDEQKTFSANDIWKWSLEAATQFVNRSFLCRPLG